MYVLGMRPCGRVSLVSTSPDRIAPKHLEQPGLCPDTLQCRGDLRVGAMPIDVHQKDVFAERLLAGSRFELGHVDARARQLLQRVHQDTSAILGEAEAHAGLVVTGRRAILAAERDEARDIARTIL